MGVALITYLPSKSVITPMAVPLMITLTPMSGSSVVLSLTNQSQYSVPVGHLQMHQLRKVESIEFLFSYFLDFRLTILTAYTV